jgi:hypothetical protein
MASMSRKPAVDPASHPKKKIQGDEQKSQSDNLFLPDKTIYFFLQIDMNDYKTDARLKLKRRRASSNLPALLRE